MSVRPNPVRSRMSVGNDATKAGSDAVLEDMIHELEALQLQNVSFRYATIFLQGVWGVDATLGFISR